MNKIAIFLCLSFIITVSSQGCSAKELPLNSPEKTTSAYSGICKLAVLPFVNDTKYEQGSIIFYRIFVAELHKVKGLAITQEGDVRKIYRQMRIDPKQIPNLEQLVILGDRLHSQAFITAKIIKMTEKKGSLEAHPVMAVNMQMVNAVSGKIMMTMYASHTGEDYREIMHFGLINTITELATAMSDEIITKWFKEGEGKCP